MWLLEVDIVGKSSGNVLKKKRMSSLGLGNLVKVFVWNCKLVLPILMMSMACSSIFPPNNFVYRFGCWSQSFWAPLTANHTLKNCKHYWQWFSGDILWYFNSRFFDSHQELLFAHNVLLQIMTILVPTTVFGMSRPVNDALGLCHRRQDKLSKGAQPRPESQDLGQG